MESTHVSPAVPRRSARALAQAFAIAGMASALVVAGGITLQFSADQPWLRYVCSFVWVLSPLFGIMIGRQLGALLARLCGLATAEEAKFLRSDPHEQQQVPRRDSRVGRTLVLLALINLTSLLALDLSVLLGPALSDNAPEQLHIVSRGRAYAIHETLYDLRVLQRRVFPFSVAAGLIGFWLNRRLPEAEQQGGNQEDSSRNSMH